MVVELDAIVYGHFPIERIALLQHLEHCIPICNSTPIFKVPLICHTPPYIAVGSETRRDVSDIEFITPKGIKPNATQKLSHDE